MKLALIGIAMFVVTSVVAGGVWAYAQIQPASETEKSRYITIEEGSTLGQVANTLEQKGVVRNGTAFYMYARFYEQAPHVKSGFYRLSPHQDVSAILNVLIEGRVENMTVRIPSGRDLQAIRSLLRETGFPRSEIQTALEREYDVPILKHKPADVSLEGYIYPDTYHIAANANASDLIRMALVNTERHVSSELERRFKEHDLSVHEGITLASIVQKEAADPENRAQIAQVFLTRLEDDQPLEADPTFQYVARRQGVEPSIDIDSPYNTYQNRGLPPGPISTVTAGALEAVAHPADTQYRYFVTGEDGVTRFSKTRRQHKEYIKQHGVSGS